jgi:hypothetical protein
MLELFNIFVIAAIFAIALIIVLIAFATMKQTQCFVAGV